MLNLLSNMQRRLFCLVSSFVCCSLAGAEVLQTVTRNTPTRFFALEGGAVAFLPEIVRSEEIHNPIRYEVLPQSGVYKLPKSPRYCFVVNNRSDSLRLNERTYLGVSIVSFLSEKHAEHSSMGRNDGWFREGDEQYEQENDSSKTVRLQIEHFFDAHASKNSLSKLDEELQHEWHGLVRESEIASQERHYLWDLTDKLKSLDTVEENFNRATTGSVDRRIDALLLAFKPLAADKRKPDEPLGFCFAGDARVAAYVSLFVPDTNEFSKQFFLILE